MMVSVIGQDEEVEEASFMPRAFRRGDDNAMRKWEARDVGMKVIDAEIGGGTFGEQRKKQHRTGSASDAQLEQLQHSRNVCKSTRGVVRRMLSRCTEHVIGFSNVSTRCRLLYSLLPLLEIVTVVEP